MALAKLAAAPETHAMSSTVRQRQVTTLLRDYRAWHTAFGGGLPIEDSYMRGAAYGPSALIEAGVYFPRKWRPALAVSFEKLEYALTMLKNDGITGRLCYLLLLAPYLGDPADPSIVTRWRKERPGLADWHDLAIKKLAGYLASHDLFVIWPKRMTSQEAQQIEHRNAELFGLYKRLVDEGTNKTEAVKQAALMCGYGKRRAWEIVRAREPGDPAKPSRPKG